MLTALIVVFVVGYLAITLEHPLRVDKAAIALVLGMLMWVIYALGADSLVPGTEGFTSFIGSHAELSKEPLHKQVLEYILDVNIVEHLGDIMQTLLFLLGAMTIVEMVDVHGGFRVITDRINTNSKRKLLIILTIVTFFMSAVLDNLTTTIVMLMLLGKLVKDQKERWTYAGMIVIAANSGGAWSPIGDVTTIMLWVNGNVTSEALVKFLLLPSLVSVMVPLAVVCATMKGELAPREAESDENPYFTASDRKTIFTLGVAGLIFVPIFKSLTHLPPFIGMLLVLGVLWIYTERLYNKKQVPADKQMRIPKVLGRVDMPSILFFLGILMAVAVLEVTGILGEMASFLDQKVHNVYATGVILGVLSSIVDNVPLVAGVMGMYPVEAVGATGYAANFVQDGVFWELMSYCAGVGGSILIIGSAAGVIAMGLEKINFGWYLKKISWLALIGYLAGVGVYMLEKMLFC